MTSQTLDCTLCGACCFGSHDRYVALLPEDRDRAIPEAATSAVDGRRFMKMSGGHCAQLCRTDDARLVCAIYTERPEACRAFRAGSFECGKARQHRLILAETLRRPEPAVPAVDLADVPDPWELPGAGPRGRLPV